MGSNFEYVITLPFKNGLQKVLSPVVSSSYFGDPIDVTQNINVDSGDVVLLPRKVDSR